MEGVIGVVTTVAYDFAPRNWAYCNGQLLAIAQNQALFSILGTTYGGNGVQTFGLPNLQSRAPVGIGQGPGLSNYVSGEVSGSETASMSINSMPAHSHNGTITMALKASSGAGEDSIPEGNSIGSGLPNTFSSNANTNLATPTYAPTIGISGSGQSFNVLNPYITLNYVICLYGIFPSRN